jgi:osmoprotectant transport system permease protein
VHIFGEVTAWFGAPEQWSGSGAIPTRVWEHLGYSIPAVLAAIIPAVMLGLYVGHTRRLEFLVSVSGLARALPSFGVLAFFFPISLQLGLGLSFWPTFIALFFLAVPPILTNTYVGVREVDRDAVQAARGMGLTEREILRLVELPLAAPVIVGGIRTSAVQVVATATLAALVAGGGLGRYIADGLANFDHAQVIGGAILVAALAIVTEVVLGWIERRVRPKTSSAGPEKVRGYRYVGQAPQPGPPSI